MTNPKLSQIISKASSAALIANGTLHDYHFIASLIRNYDCCIAVDGGLFHCREMNITPDLIIGDFDSISLDILNLYKDVPTEVVSTEKDLTDMELAIDVVNVPNMNKIALFGAMESRTDHAIVNLLLLSRFPQKMFVETEKETLFCIEGKKQFLCTPGQTVSLIPIGSPAKGVTTKGLKWELTDVTLSKDFFSLSNICLGAQFEVSIEQGRLICCLLRHIL